MKKYMLMVLVTIVLAVILNSFLMMEVQRRMGRPIENIIQTHDVTLAPNGTGRMRSVSRSRFNGGGKTAEFNFYTDVPVQVQDDRGNILPYEMGKKNGRSVMAVEFPTAASFPRNFDIIWTGPIPWMAKKNGDHWEYTHRHWYGSPIRYTNTVHLPAGAKLISVEPKAAEVKREGNRTMVMFKNDVGKINCTITYALP